MLLLTQLCSGILFYSNSFKVWGGVGWDGAKYDPYVSRKTKRKEQLMALYLGVGYVGEGYYFAYLNILYRY